MSKDVAKRLDVFLDRAQADPRLDPICGRIRAMLVGMEPGSFCHIPNLIKANTDVDPFDLLMAAMRMARDGELTHSFRTVGAGGVLGPHHDRMEDIPDEEMNRAHDITTGFMKPGREAT
jgi:hypothetical protein